MTRSFLAPAPQCFNSVKINGKIPAALNNFIIGLSSVEQLFVPCENLLACRRCGVIFTRDKAASHFGLFY